MSRDFKGIKWKQQNNCDAAAPDQTIIFICNMRRLAAVSKLLHIQKLLLGFKWIEPVIQKLNIGAATVSE